MNMLYTCPISPYKALCPIAAGLTEDWARTLQSTCPRSTEKQWQQIKTLEPGVEGRVFGREADHGLSKTQEFLCQDGCGQ